jgi:Spy/CpxP family protein refolding chaperone
MLDIIKERRMMQIAVAILVILNLALITSMIIQKPPFPGNQAPRPGLEIFLAEELKLSEAQVDAFHAIRKQHFDSVHPILDRMNDSLELLISEAFNPDRDPDRVKELNQNTADIHAQMDYALYDHFVQLNEICTPEQRGRLKKLARELTRGGNQPPPQEGPRQAGRPPHPGGQTRDGRLPPPGQGAGPGAPPPKDR